MKKKRRNSAKKDLFHHFFSFSGTWQGMPTPFFLDTLANNTFDFELEKLHLNRPNQFDEHYQQKKTGLTTQSAYKTYFHEATQETRFPLTHDRLVLLPLKKNIALGGFFLPKSKFSGF